MAVFVWSAFVVTCLLYIYHAAHSWLLYTVYAYTAITSFYRHLLKCTVYCYYRFL